MHDACHGFVTGRSTVTNAAPYQRAALVLTAMIAAALPRLATLDVRKNAIAAAT